MQLKKLSNRALFLLTGTRMMSTRELNVEMESAGISVWTKPWSNRSARVTLLVDFRDRFAIVTDPRSGFWFLPGRGTEKNESIEEAAKREAVEELGIKVNVSRIIATFDATLISKATREHLKIPPFVVVYATPVGGKLKKAYASNREILLVRKGECNVRSRNLEVPRKYEWMKPYSCVSREVVREFLI